MNAASENANVVIGIDVQSDSQAIKIVDNTVNLDSTVGTDSGDKYIGLHVRENAGGTCRDKIKVSNNTNIFTQEE